MTFHFEAWNNTERKHLQLVAGNILRRLIVRNTTEDIFALFTHGFLLASLYWTTRWSKIIKTISVPPEMMASFASVR